MKDEEMRAKTIFWPKKFCPLKKKNIPIGREIWYFEEKGRFGRKIAF